MKKTFSILLTVMAVWAVTVGCNKTSGTEEEHTDPPIEDLTPFTTSMEIPGDGIVDNQPSFTLHLENPNTVEMKADIQLSISTDQGSKVGTYTQTAQVAASAAVDVELRTDAVLDPGFYRLTCVVNNQTVRKFVFGVDPFHVVSAPDKQPDFDEFWEAAKAQLPAIVPEEVYMYEIAGKSNANCKVYFVELASVPDGPDGDPVLVHGYYLEPQDGQKHPVLMHFYGYDTLNSKARVSCPSGDGKYAEFYLSHRGQYLNRTTADKREPDGKGDFENIYGDWFAFNFGKKDGYYYRGAFMDCVQAVNFMATRPTSDMGNLFAEGSSQGGALSYAVAALSDYPFTAITPCVAFLGDYPDYFKIVSWPGDVAKKSAKAAGLSDEEMYKFLSYFDTKNLATRIPATTAVLACSGVQDGTCPPHTNLAPYNNLLTTDKEYYFYPKMGHEIPGDWSSKQSKFFKARIK